MQISATSVFVSLIKNSLRPAVWSPHDKTDDPNLAQNTPSSVGLNRRRFYSECTNQPRLLSHAAGQSPAVDTTVGRDGGGGLKRHQKTLSPVASGLKVWHSWPGWRLPSNVETQLWNSSAHSMFWGLSLMVRHIFQKLYSETRGGFSGMQQFYFSPNLLELSTLFWK